MSSFYGGGNKPWVHSNCAGDLRELLKVPLSTIGLPRALEDFSGEEQTRGEGRRPRSICTDYMKQYPLLRRGKKIAYHPTPLLPGPDLPPGHRAVTVKFPTIEKEESTLTTEGLWLLQGPPLTQFPLLSLALQPHCPSSSPPPQGWSGKESPSLIPLNAKSRFLSIHCPYLSFSFLLLLLSCFSRVRLCATP